MTSEPYRYNNRFSINNPLDADYISTDLHAAIIQLRNKVSKRYNSNIPITISVDMYCDIGMDGSKFKDISHKKYNFKPINIKSIKRLNFSKNILFLHFETFECMVHLACSSKDLMVKMIKENSNLFTHYIYLEGSISFIEDIIFNIRKTKFEAISTKLKTNIPIILNRLNSNGKRNTEEGGSSTEQVLESN